MKNKLNEVIIYVNSIIFCLNLTKLYNNDFFDILSLVVVIISCLQTAFYFKEIFSIQFIKKNFLIIIYILFRIISIIILNINIQNFKILAYEIYFLIVVYSIFKKENRIVNNTIKIIIMLNVIINLITIILWRGTFDFEKMIYTNPNSMGNFTCICLIMYVTFFIKENKKIISIIYMIFCILIICLTESRTPIIIIVTYCFLRIITKHKLLSREKIKLLFISGIVLINITVIAFSYYNKNNTMPSNIETMVNDYTTNRYYLWKYSIISLEESPVFGISGDEIGTKRYSKVPEEMFEYIVGSRKRMLSNNNNHNGYVQMLVSNGYLMFVVFVAWIYVANKKIAMDNFYIIASILVLNLFENLLIFTPNIFGFLLIYLLAQEERKEEKNLYQKEKK